MSTLQTRLESDAAEAHEAHEALTEDGMRRYADEAALEPLDWEAEGLADEGTPDLAVLDAVLEEADAWLDDTALLPDEATRDRLRRAVRQVRERRDQLLAPLVIAIVGGTGVGKSTLLNALAGDAIARAGVQRPTTQQVTVYHHADNSLALDPALAPADRRAAHTRPALRDKVLVDTPDYDSTEAAHRRRLEAALAHADVILWVVTAEKYADLKGARWLRAFGRDRLVAFALNRADEGVTEDLLADVRRHIDGLGFDDAPLFRISALQAYEAKEAGRTPPESFQDLETLLEAELDAKQIRAVKEANFAAQVRGLIAQMEAALPEGLRRRLDQWRQRGESVYGDLRDELAARLAPRVTAHPRLMRHVEYWLGTNVGGPVGGTLSLVYGLRALVSPAWPKLWEAAEAPDIAVAAEGDAPALIHAEVNGARRRLKALATDAGLPGGGTDLDAPDDGPETALAHRLDERLRRATGEALHTEREAVGRGLRTAGTLLNIPSVALLIAAPIWLIYQLTAPLFGKLPLLPPDMLIALVAVGLLLWFGLATWAAQAAVRKATGNFLQRLGWVVTQAVDKALRKPVLGRLEDRLGALDAEASALDRLRRRLEG